MVMRYSPKKRYFLLSAKLRERVGALADFTRILAIREVNLLEGRVHVSDASEGYVAFFVEATNPRVDADFLEQMLKGSSFLETLTVVEGKDGMIVDSASFPMVSGLGKRSILLDADSARDLIYRLTEKLGTGAGDIVYQLGVEYGSNAWSGAVGGLVRGEESLQLYLQLFEAVGMGKVRLEEFREGDPSMVVSVERLFECNGLSSSSPRSFFFRGALAGIAGSLFGREMSAREVACVASGAKRCRFEVSPRT
jgi:predicted hydrocarbon binding protein